MGMGLSSAFFETIPWIVAYDEQLGWLRSHLADYETRASGNVRGDAKKFALEMASKYIEKWGVPEGEKETTVREQIYTWFKNTSARGKEARKRHQLMKSMIIYIYPVSRAQTPSRG